MRIKWWAADGYVGKDRPHYVEVPDEELAGLEEAARNDLIDDYVRDEFLNKVFPEWEIVG